MKSIFNITLLYNHKKTTIISIYINNLYIYDYNHYIYEYIISLYEYIYIYKLLNNS